jgi:hypothetical protein
MQEHLHHPRDFSASADKEFISTPLKQALWRQWPTPSCLAQTAKIHFT